MSINSNIVSLNLENVVGTLLSEEIRKRSMDGNYFDALVIRGRSKEKKYKNNIEDTKSYVKKISKSIGKSKLKC